MKTTRVKAKGSLPGRSLKRIEKSAEVLSKTSSMFGLPSKKVYSLLEEGDTDQAISYFQKQMLAVIVRLIPIAEKQYRIHKKESQAYAMNSLISQARELTTDIQMSNDRAAVAERIISELLMPVFRSFIETLVVQTKTLEGVLGNKMKAGYKRDLERALEGLLQETARTGNQLFKESASEIRLLLGANSKKQGSKS